MDIQIGDVLIMKKPHPCGENRFTVGRVGMDFRIRCVGCGREVMVPRAKVEKNIKKVLRGEPSSGGRNSKSGICSGLSHPLKRETHRRERHV